MSKLPSFIEPEAEVITFDCYGTLVQWFEVLQHEIDVTLSKQRANKVSASSILDSFSAQGRRLTAERPHRLYKDILRIGFAAAFAEHGLTPSNNEIERIASSPMKMEPHPEVPDVLRRLRERYKLAIFTNSDDDLIAPTVARIGVPFDYVITAERAQAYKPSRQLFEYAYRTMDVTPDETVHVAIGMYWGEAGNPDWLPYAEVDLNGAAELLLARQD